MNLKFYILILIVLSSMCAVCAQDSRVIPPQEIPAQNLLKFNRYLMNPTFTRVGLENSYISLYSRNQWVQFDDAPTTYLINYSSRVNQNVGVGLSLQQQSTGVLNYLGINANYAYGIQMSEKTWLTFGTNLSFFDSGLRASALTADSDPLLANFDETTLLSFRPGLNLTMGRFDLGVYAENLLTYDLGQNELSDQSQVFSGHLAYRQPLAGDNSMQIMTRVRRNENEDTILSGNLLLDLPSLGWAQVGYNDFFGGSIGLGINLSDRISLGYVLEQGLNSTTESLGVTHEFTVAYKFRDVSNDVTLLDDLDASLDNFVENSTAKNIEEQEIRKLKEEIEANAILIEDLQYRQDSMQRASRATSENQLKQMIAMQKVQEHMNTPALKKLPQPAVRTYTPTTYKQKSPEKFTEPIAQNEVEEEVTTTNNLQPSTKATITKVVTTSHPSGYYLIGNIFKNKRYAQRFYDKLQKDGFNNSTNLENVKNNLNYVAIDRFNSLEEATAAYSSQVNGRYTGPISILEIKDVPSSVTASLQPEIVEDRDLSTIEDVREDIAFAKAEKPKKLPQPAASSTTAVIPEKNSPEKITEPIARNEVEKEVTTTNNLQPSTKATITKVVTTSHPSGYYLIGNIFKNKRYAQRFYDKLQKDGFNNSTNLENVKNNLNYVAIDRFNSLEEATAAYSSQVNGRYTGPISILEIKDVPSSVTASLQPEIVEDRDLSTIEDVREDIAFAKTEKPRTLKTNKSIEEQPQTALTLQKEDPINTQDESKENARIDYGVIKTGDNNFQKIFSSFDNEISLNKAAVELRATGITGVSTFHKKDINQWYLAYGNFETEESAMNDSVIVDKSSYGNTAVIEVGQLINLTSPVAFEETSDNVKETSTPTPQKKATPAKSVVPQNTVVSTVPITPAKPIREKDVKTVMKSVDLNNLESGYYIIANVYAKNYWYNKFIAILEKQNLNPKTFINPKNSYKYVYLKREDTYQEAINSYKSNLNGTYMDDIWILKIE